MLTPIRLVVCGLGLTFAIWSCAPCEPIPSKVFSLCHPADAGEIAPNTSFVLEGTVGVSGTDCDVSIDGGAISLQVIGTQSCGPGVGAGARAVPLPVKCTIPALAAGTYTVNSQPEVTFTIPGDAGVPPCL